MTKIEALRKTIYNLENNVYEYNWNRYESCNCGVLARTITGGVFKTSDVFEYGTGAGMSGTFQIAVNHCKTTGMPLPFVFKALYDVGFTFEELDELELCTDCNTDKDGLIKYLKAWVEILEEKLNSEQGVQECDATMFKKVDEVGSKIIHIYHKVEVSETIQDSLPETILS